ncbi:uncharacterized protein NPIL_253081 [Nephila pilipes]|uniref:Reverse transcriptase domain-containing protein n=1 Tax=Nephila pilipes TaxID=299642 RepID=A0A8X6TGG8_NEPPI|nr:uncharacterized protein NPIL_253081 [Nephila pilipes]
MFRGFKFSQGLPHGSVLSPTLFTLALCGIEEIISRKWEDGLFADDIVIWKSENDYPIYCGVPKTDLQKLERVQLSADRIITRLQNSCPNDFVHFEADLRPLGDGRNSNLVKYYNKLLSYNSDNQTSLFLKRWSNNQGLKKNSPYSQGTSENLILIFSGEVPTLKWLNSIEPLHLYSCIEPSMGFPGVFFYPTFSAHVLKTPDPSEYLRKLVLVLINSNIPDDDILLYTDGSRNKMSYSSSGIYIRSQDDSYQFNLRNPDGCFLFRIEFTTIDSALDKILSFRNSRSIWILMDSHSAIILLFNWHSIMLTIDIYSYYSKSVFSLKSAFVPSLDKTKILLL